MGPLRRDPKPDGGDSRAFISGPVRRGTITKNLAPRLRPGDIALIDHTDVDEVAAKDLIRAGVACILNAGTTITGKYPCRGAAILLEAKVPVVDGLGRDFFQLAAEGEPVEVDLSRGMVFIGDPPAWEEPLCAARGKVLTEARVAELLDRSRHVLPSRMKQFLHNTLINAYAEEHLLLHPLTIPQLKTPFTDRHALVVVRGSGYEEDLRAIGSYIHDMKPVLIGVDGGADALLGMGLRPHIVLGDMDSVSDEALAAAREVIVHAYADGRAPGRKRLEALGIAYEIFPIGGTSEDAALLLAFEGGAALITAVGTHTHMVDFLEKGRPGMASTLLTRLRVGSRLVDAKGVSQLYHRPPLNRIRHTAQLVAAALVTIGVILLVTPLTRGILRILWLEVRMVLGI